MSARNSPCPCASGKKYKACCLKGPQPVNRILNGDGAPMRLLPSGPTCRGCVHFHEFADAGQARDLNMPAKGECREHLCGIPVVQLAPDGEVVGCQFISSGYLPTHEDFPACGRRRERETGAAGALRSASEGG